MAETIGKSGTYTGWLSFPTLTNKAAFELSQKGSYPAASADLVSPHFQLLLSQAQYEKFVAQATEFLSQEIEVTQPGGKRIKLSAKDREDLLKDITGDLSDQRYNTPLKAVHEKTAELKPEAVASLKVIGPKGGDFKVRAIVRAENEIAQTSDVIWAGQPVILDIGETVHEVYPGCVAKVTINLYAYMNGKNPGFSAGGSILVFSADGDRFGGGDAMDEEAMFLDD
jgi:hypothetical protein